MSTRSKRDCRNLGGSLESILKVGIEASLLGHPCRVQEACLDLSQGLGVVAPQVLR